MKAKYRCLDTFDDETVLHYCTREEMAEAAEKHGGLDWFIGEEGKIKELTADMAGLGTEQDQRIIIDYEKGYGKFLVRRIHMDYRTPNGAR